MKQIRRHARAGSAPNPAFQAGGAGTFDGRRPDRIAVGRGAGLGVGDAASAAYSFMDWNMFS